MLGPGGPAKAPDMRPEPFKIERYFARYEFTTRYLLCASDCEAMTLDELLAYEPGAAEAFGGHWLGYTESLGDPELRAAIAAHYAGIGPEQVLVHSGAEEAIFSFMNCALEAGDQVIVHSPCYQSLQEVARALGAEVLPWPADPVRGWSLDPERLEPLITPRTKAVVVNCPHNPTGYLMPAEQQAALIETARRHGLWLFSDEVYRGLEYHPAERLPAACEAYERAVSLGVLSKTYGLPGLRIGWIATRDAEIFARMAAFKDYLTICNAAPSEFLARIALRHHEAIAARNRAIVRDNLALLDGFFERRSERFAWVRPRAGAIAFPEHRPGGIEALSQKLAAEAEVLLLPGGVYDAGDSHFRLGFGRRNFAKGLAALEAALDRGL